MIKDYLLNDLLYVLLERSALAVKHLTLSSSLQGAQQGFVSQQSESQRFLFNDLLYVLLDLNFRILCAFTSLLVLDWKSMQYLSSIFFTDSTPIHDTLNHHFSLIDLSIKSIIDNTATLACLLLNH